MSSPKSITIFTIGFTKKNAEKFFNLLKDNGVKRIVDTRLNNVSQLAGFAKRDDLKFFLKNLKGRGIDYVHDTELAPEQDILDNFKKTKGKIDEKWEIYKGAFNKLIEGKEIEKKWENKDILDGDCLLCSEHEPNYCHRSLVVEYLQKKWEGKVEIEIIDLPLGVGRQPAKQEKSGRPTGIRQCWNQFTLLLGWRPGEKGK